MANHMKVDLFKKKIMNQVNTEEYIIK